MLLRIILLHPKKKKNYFTSIEELGKLLSTCFYTLKKGL